MRLLLTLALLSLLASGCTNSSGGGGPSGAAPVHNQGTDVGTSNPGVNQPTQTTTATRSNDTPPH